MKSKLFFAFQLFLISLPSFCQTTGINFETSKSWTEILDSAKKQNKNIFIDFYATWCGPCLAMDKNVYTLDSVGKFFNRNFICVKIQADSSKKDSDFIIRWRNDALLLRSKFKINGYPSYLFLSPDGNIVHRAIGGYDADKFIEIAKNAIDPKKQYYRLIQNYKNRTIDRNIIPELAISAKSFGDINLANEIAADLLGSLNISSISSKEIKLLTIFSNLNLSKEISSKYIQSKNEKDLLTRENIELICAFTNSAKDPGFNILYKYETTIDSLFSDHKNISSKHYARVNIERIIMTEIIKPYLSELKQKGVLKPNWNKLRNKIAKLHSKDYANRTIESAKSRWYNETKNWKLYTKSLVKWVSISDDNENSFFINNCAWEIFERSNERSEILAASAWMEAIIKITPEAHIMTQYCLDTYANLLYKLGNKQLAIFYEKKSLDSSHPSFQSNLSRLEKMELDIPTWQ